MGDAVHIFISDERQHALPRWLEHAHRIGPRHLVLVHIDAHSNLAIPGAFGANPAPPIGRENPRTSTDEFVEYAKASRLVKRIVCVLPDWAVRNKGGLYNEWADGEIPPERAILHVGHFEGDPSEPCDCIERGPRLAREASAMVCEALEHDTIEPEECSLQFGAPTQAVLESAVRKHSIRIRDCIRCTPEDLAQPLDVILDIDEDYFATGDLVGDLAATGWTNKTLALVDSTTMRFCANTEAEEAELASFLADMVAALLRDPSAPSCGGGPCAARKEQHLALPPGCLQPGRLCPRVCHVPAGGA